MNTFKVGPTKYASEGELNLDRYASGRGIAITVTDPETGESLYRATVMVDLSPNENCVWLKGWGENEGVPEAFVKAGLGTLTGRTCLTGYTRAREFKLNDELIEASNNV